MPDVVPTRSAYLELQDERHGMQEGYRFLDEKRLILAGELLRVLREYQARRTEFDQLYREAVAALRAAVGRHGIEGLSIYPALRTRERIQRRSRNVLGVSVGEARLETAQTDAPPAVQPSPEGELCRDLYHRVIEQATALAALHASLLRLWREYTRTSRRARALEDVMLPEMERTLREIEADLEEQDREEAVRVRHFTRTA
jgi:V/A-type H+-transporting ATPase subunit D